MQLNFLSQTCWRRNTVFKILTSLESKLTSLNTVLFFEAKSSPLLFGVQEYIVYYKASSGLQAIIAYDPLVFKSNVKKSINYVNWITNIIL